MENVLLELTKLFKEINSLLGIAFQDVHEKVGVMRRNRVDNNIPTLYPTIKKEMELNLHNCNGGNNKKFECP